MNSGLIVSSILYLLAGFVVGMVGRHVFHVDFTDWQFWALLAGAIIFHILCTIGEGLYPFKHD